MEVECGPAESMSDASLVVAVVESITGVRIGLEMRHRLDGGSFVAQSV